MSSCGHTCSWRLTRSEYSSACLLLGGLDRLDVLRGGKHSQEPDRRVFGRCLLFFFSFYTSFSDFYHLRASSFFYNDPCYTCEGRGQNLEVWLIHNNNLLQLLHVELDYGLLWVSRGVVSSLPLQRRREVQNRRTTSRTLSHRVWTETKHGGIRKTIGCPSLLY